MNVVGTETSILFGKISQKIGLFSLYRGPRRVSFGIQGHNEPSYPGQALSKDVLSAKCKLAVNPKSPIVRTVEKRQAIDGRTLNGDNAELKVPLSAPGKIVCADYKCGGRRSWLTPLRINYNGDEAAWYGMTNSDLDAVLSFTIGYKLLLRLLFD
jgi:hypothetical protein